MAPADFYIFSHREIDGSQCAEENTGGNEVIKDIIPAPGGLCLTHKA